MGTSRLVALAVATQLGLVALATAGAQLSGVRFTWGRPVRDAALGAVVALALAIVNFLLLHRPWGIWRQVRSAVDEVLIPTFAALTPGQAALIAVAAGLGEELFFRGFLQPLAGVAAASAVFGLAHVAGLRMAAFGLWAAAMGAVLGGLTVFTGGLIAAITAHACYDLLGFNYLRIEGRRQASQGRARARG